MKRSLRDRVATRIARSQRDVFLTRDFADLSDEDQIIRALRALVTQRSLVRLGKGVYAKARASRISGRPVLANAAGFQLVAQEALTRLGVKWQATDAQRAYAEGRSTQVPVNPVVKVVGRFARKLRYGNSVLLIERQPSAGRLRG
ncbi:MAG: hypothetical protein IPO66_19565, partial [Rhodanobacteraceae bacterium]|nr:hypothetical protein [Rhodanobacteraceae bacterium]